MVGWTYLASTSMARSDLNLVRGQAYYVTVQARNASGLWSIDSVSTPVLAGETPPTATPTTPSSGFSIFLPTINR